MIINNSELVEMFGSKKNKESYNRTKKVTGSMKKSLISNANVEYDITDLGKGRYEIFPREYRLPKSWTRAKGTENEYLCYLILDHLKHNAHGHILDALRITPIGYYGKIEAMSKNFNRIRYDKINYSNDNNIPLTNIHHFYERNISNLKERIIRCLNILKDVGALSWQENRYICLFDLEYNETILNKRGRLIGTKNFIHRRATEEELQYEQNTENEIMQSLQIKNKSEAYYGRKSGDFFKSLKDEYKYRNIKYYYDSFEVYYSNINILNNILKDNPYSIEFCKNEFNRQIMNSMLNNAKKLCLKSSNKNLDFSSYFKDVELLVEDGVNNKSKIYKYDKNNYFDIDLLEM